MNEKTRHLPERTCPVCKNRFKARHQGSSKGKGKLTTYCSRACYQADCAKKRTAMALDKNVLKKKIHSTDCKKCGSVFLSNTKHKKLCEACRAKKNEAWVAKRKKNPRQFVCKCCGVPCVSEYGDRLRVFCSETCRKRFDRRSTKARRKAMKRGAGRAESIDPNLVFRRAGWVCAWCGVATPVWLRGTYSPFAPELDHIVPLSKGGEHTYENTQCLCRRCNAGKSDHVSLESAEAA